MSRRKRSAFGEYVAIHLSDRGMTQDALASAAGRSQSYTNQIINGKRVPSPEWANLIADVLNLPEDDRKRLHAAAAKDNGFDIELPEFNPPASRTTPGSETR